MSAYTTENGVYIEDLRKIMPVCEVNDVTYVQIRAAQTAGARSRTEVLEATGACGECSGCRTHIPWIRKFVCRCNQVSFDEILAAMAEGATTQEAITEKTKAGSSCGRCKTLTATILETGK